MRTLNPSATTRWQRLLSQAGVYLELTKPRMVALVVFTAVVGMFLATLGFVPLDVLVLATQGISLATASAAAFNYILERRSTRS